MQVTLHDNVFLSVALAVSQLSKDPSTKVGCVLVSPDRKLISIGYNGFPSGLPESEAMWADKASKDILCKGTAVLHAEENALLNSRQDVRGWACYVTHHPCVYCMGRLGNAGIKTVMYLNTIKPEYKPELAAILADQLGIKVIWASQYSFTMPRVPTVDPKTITECTQMGIHTASDASTTPCLDLYTKTIQPHGITLQESALWSH